MTWPVTRFRTCRGFDVARVEIEITDEGDEERHEVFPKECSDGFQTPEELQLAGSDVFIPLRSGSYDVVLRVIGSSLRTPRVRCAPGRPSSGGAFVQLQRSRYPPSGSYFRACHRVSNLRPGRGS